MLLFGDASGLAPLQPAFLAELSGQLPEVGSTMADIDGDNDEMSNDLPLLNARDLRQLAGRAEAKAPCDACSELICPGWESLPGAFDRSRLRRIGTLRQVSDEEPTVSEHHPAGTNAWSPDAPIAPAYFPYNRCDVWRCAACKRVFLRYTEYGGYYEDERIRELDASLVDDTPA